MSAIIHIDGDAFFANCERACDPALKDKPVVVGKERGIATAACYRAKAAGIERGTLISKVKNICPSAVVKHGDYSKYKLISQRMYKIFRDMGDIVEEYSIDESFVGLAGAGNNGSYTQIAKQIQKKVKDKLDIPVSVGLAPNKTLAKVASDKNKPRGFCKITQSNVDQKLKGLPTDELWGIGSRLAQRLDRIGVDTALEFKNMSRDVVSSKFNKKVFRLHKELHCSQMIPLERGSVAKHKSKGSSKTFSPETKDKTKVFSHLSKNVETACKRLRKYNLVSDKISFFIKRNDYEGGYTKYKAQQNLNLHTAHPSYILPRIRDKFNEIFKADKTYRATGCYLHNLRQATPQQLGLLESYLEKQDKSKVYDAVDKIEDKFGDGTVFLASSLSVRASSSDQNKRKDKDKKLGIPSMGEVR